MKATPELKRLTRAFYARPVLQVARDCIGKLLVLEHRGSRLGGRIVEAEAYCGPKDRAAHSYGGRRTRRTEAMFGPAGHVYVFLVYGVHWNFNVVTGQPGQPEAVLIRAIEPQWGLPRMRRRRGLTLDSELTNGPGKLCQALGIGRQHYGVDLCEGPLYLGMGPSSRVARSKRVGIDYAGAWAEKKWRFYDPASKYVSGPRRSTARTS